MLDRPCPSGIGQGRHVLFASVTNRASTCRLGPLVRANCGRGTLAFEALWTKPGAGFRQ